MWLYVQDSGFLYHGARLISKGYAGKDQGKNNPAMQSVHDVGPLPCGRHYIGKSFTHPTKGPVSMRLIPDAATETFGRSGFMIHGDSAAHLGEASEGCMIFSRSAREAIDQSDDKLLEVIATEDKK